jgi:RNA polymerase sigma-70 factor (ECF subfamily)
MNEHVENVVRVPEEARGALGTSFESFFQAQQATLYRRLCLLTGDRAEAEELMQDAFLKLWERWDRVGAMDDPEGYLYRTALNLFRKRYRRATLALRRAVGVAHPEDAFVGSEQRTAVSAALATLTPRQRAALVLTQLLEFSSEEAGELLHVRPATVRALATQGRAALKATMEDPR